MFLTIFTYLVPLGLVDMSNRGNRFKKIGSKLRNFSSKVDDFVLGPDFNSNNKNEDDFSNLDHIIVPEHNDNYVLEDFSGSKDSSSLVSSNEDSSLAGSKEGSSLRDSKKDSSLLDSDDYDGAKEGLNGSNIKNHTKVNLNDDFNKFSDDLNEKEVINKSVDDEVDDKYSKYLDSPLDEPKEKYLNELNFSPLEEGSSPLDDDSSDEGFSYSNGHFNSRYHNAIQNEAFDNEDSNGNVNHGAIGGGSGGANGIGDASDGRFDSLSDGLFSDGVETHSNGLFSDGVETLSDGIFNNAAEGPINDEASSENSSLKDSLRNFKKELLNKDAKSKSRFGKIAFVLIFLVLASSLLYFLVYQPFQEELNLERNSKLNELNALYKGPLEVHENAYSLKNQIETTYDIEELKSIDVLRTATEDWKNYHKSSIVKSRDNYNRVMLSYTENDTRNVILSVSDAQDFVKDNDAKVLSNVQFKKVDTVIVPISLSRLQATAGLIYVGSIVDIYSLDENDTYDYSSSDANSEEITVESSDNSSLDESNESSADASLNDSGDYKDDELDLDKGPDVSGATVLAILRSKDSGVVDSEFSRSSLKVDGNVSTPNEKTNSFSTDVEELLKASAFGSYSGSDALESYLDSYGVKLSNYERMSNLGELDSEYIILLEVPRTDVDFIINNMDDLILTIPTQFAPDWVANELSQAYYEELEDQNNDTLF